MLIEDDIRLKAEYCQNKVWDDFFLIYFLSMATPLLLLTMLDR